MIFLKKFHLKKNIFWIFLKKNSDQKKNIFLVFFEKISIKKIWPEIYIFGVEAKKKHFFEPRGRSCFRDLQRNGFVASRCHVF